MTGARGWREVPGYVLLAGGLVILAVAGDRWELCGPLLVLVGLHPLIGRRVVWPWTQPPEENGQPALVPVSVIQALLLGLPVAALPALWPVEGRSGLGVNVPFHVSLYILVLAVIKLYAPWDSRRFGVLLFAAASAVAACGADVRFDVYGPYVAVFAAASLVGLRAHLPVDLAARGPSASRLRHGLAAGSILLVLGLTLGTTAAARVYERELGALWQRFRLDLTDALPTSPGGFSDEAKLGNVSDLKGGGRTVALRAEAARAPGYLRGRAFLRYESGMWTSQKESLLHVNPSRGVRRLPGRPLPQGSAPLRIYTTSRFGAHLFLPLEASAVETTDGALMLYTGNALKGTRVSSSLGYGVFTDDEPVRDQPERPSWLHSGDIPELDAALDRVADRIGFTGSETRAQVVAKVTEYFAGRYTYKVGIEFDPERELLTQFLEEKTHGHCELFASSGALLLRRRGIPARYVTGFVCEERSSISARLWIARNEHAHAWVEYYDVEGGWRVAEFTPAGAMPPNSAATGAEAFFDWLGGLWERLKGGEGLSDVVAGLVAGAKAGLGWLVGAWWRIPALVLPVVGFLAFRYRRRRPPASLARRVLSPEVAVAREAFLALEARLAREGLGRRGAETLLEYATRLTAAGDLPDRSATLGTIRSFSALRYARES